MEVEKTESGAEVQKRTLSPEAKAQVEKINTTFESLQQRLKDEQEARGELSEGVKANLKEMADNILDMEARLTKMVQGRDVVTNPNQDVPLAELQDADDVRESKEFRESFDAFLRSEDSRALTKEAWNKLQEGNKQHVQRLRAQLERSDGEPQASLSRDFGPGGGVWVRPTFERTVTQRIVEHSPIREHATVKTIAGSYYESVIRSPFRDKIKRVAERGSRVRETERRRYETRKIPVHNWYVFPALTTNQIEDGSLDMEAEIRSDVELDFAVDESHFCFHGAGGDNEPLGVLNDSTIEMVKSGVADDVTLDGALRLAFSLPDLYRRTGSYAIHRSALINLMLEKDANDRPLWQPSNQEGLPSMLHSFPWWEASDLEEVAAGSRSIVFGDWSRAYYIIDRRGIKVIRDEITQPGIVGFNMERRWGAGTWLTEAIQILETGV